MMSVASRPNLAPLLRAQSVAIVGLSQLPRFGGWIYENLRAAGYAGRVFGVNPRYTTLFDQPCYASLSDLPERPDCAVLAVPNERLLSTLQEAGALGIPAAVIFASAFSEPQPGQPSLQAQLAQIARAHQIALCGPNCMGFLAPHQRLLISGYEVKPDVPAGGVAFISHSGSLWEALWQNRRGVHFNYLISAGNEIVTTLADYMLFALDDPGTRVIGLFLETVRDPQTFRAALEAAAERDVPIVALKVGRSEQGARLAQVHSGALAGQDAAYDALFAHYGVRRVRSLDEMLDTLELFAAGLRTPTRHIAAIHDSGGERGLLVDLAEAEGVSFAPLSAETTARLAAALEPGLAPLNPLDAWGTGNEFDRIYLECLLALDADPATGLTVWAADLTPAGAVSRTYVATALANRARFTRPLVFLSNVSSAASEALAERLRAAGIPSLLGTENGLRAIRHLIEYSHYQRERRSGTIATAPVKIDPACREALRRQLQAATGPLGEYESQPVLRAYGVEMPTGTVVASLSEALEAARAIGVPVALKTAMGELHKSDRGGVRLHLTHSEAVANAYHELAERFGPRVLVQQMAPPGVELILGLIRDAQFGLMLTLGLGGLFVEVFNDVRVLALPVTPDQVHAALLSLRGAPLLHGARGRPSVNMEAVVDTALSLSALAADLGDWIDAVDINPLIASPDGALAVDALIVPSSNLQSPITNN